MIYYTIMTGMSGCPLVHPPFASFQAAAQITLTQNHLDRKINLTWSDDGHPSKYYPRSPLDVAVIARKLMVYSMH